MGYSVKAIDAADHSSLDMQKVKRALGKSAGATARKEGIDAIISLHNISRKTTNSVDYDATMTNEGINIEGDIRIGPEAFVEDRPWLAQIVFHEIVHSDQWKYYAERGLKLIVTPPVAEPARILKGLDEHECHGWVVTKRVPLGLSEKQVRSVQTRRQIAGVEFEDDREIKGLVDTGKYAEARRVLVDRWFAAAAKAKTP